MKKAISTILALVMVLAVVAAIPMTVGAETVYNTSRFFATNSTTGLDAYAGTPVMGAAQGATTVKDDVWNNAYKLVVNADTIPYYNGFGSGKDFDVYMLWDNDNLYILQDVRAYNIANGLDGKTNTKTATEPYPYKGYEVNSFNILLSRDFGGSTPQSFNVFVLPALSDPNVTGQSDGVQTGEIYEGVVRVRSMDYTSATANNGNKKVLSYDTTYAAGLRTYIEKTDAGYISETKIPWSFLDSTSNKEFANAADKTGLTFGVKINHKNSYVMNNDGITVDGTALNNDTAGHDPVTLCAAADPAKTNYKTTATAITPDQAYWIGENGLFTKKDGDGEYLYKKGGQTYEIYTAAQLLGLAQILEAGTNTAIVPTALPGITAAADKAYLSRNNTFKLMNDIDLNPGVTDWAKANEFFANKYSGKSADYAKTGTPMPVNVFYGFDRFFGVIDGQGHAIKGLYNPNTPDVSWRSAGITNATGGLIGQLGQGGIKDLVVESGYLGISKMASNLNFGGLVGEIRTEALTDYTKAYFIFENIYVGENYTAHIAAPITESNYGFGGVVSSIWPGIKDKGVTVNATFKNIVYSGDLLIDDGSKVNCEVVLAKNFNSTDKAVTNGTTKIACTYSNIVANVDATPASNAITNTRYTKVVKGSGIPEGKETEMAVMADGGVAPLLVADMAAKTRWQATTVDADGRFNVRFVSEVDASDFELFENIGHFITITATKGNETKTYEVDFTENTAIYSSVIADGKTVTADSAEFAVKGGTHLIASVISLKAEEGVTYSIDIVTCYDGVDGYVQNIGVVAPWN